MTKLLLGNIAYTCHTTDEGHQLQMGLNGAGWELAGYAFSPDNCVDVRKLVERHNPQIVFMQDARDWRLDSQGCYDVRCAFKNWQYLRERPDIIKVTPAKDAGSVVEYQRKFAEEIGLNIAVTYYHDQSILPLSPWLNSVKRVRTYHTIDSQLAASIDLNGPRQRGIVTGAVSDVYPLRQLAFRNSSELRLHRVPHPGYAAAGCHTPRYLKMLAGFKVHVATASRYNFFLRKITESVAMGCTPVTDLVETIPEIDEALVRVPPNASLAVIADAINRAESEWNLERVTALAAKDRQWYDYREMGKRLDADIMAAI